MNKDILYDTYSIPTKGKSKKQVLSILENEAASYAYIAEDHVSIGKSVGYSFIDMIVNEIKQSSFVYIGEIEEGNYYLLIIIDNQTLFSGEIKSFDIEAKLSLYELLLNDSVVFYLHKFTASCIDDREIKQIRPDIYDEYNLKPYKLVSVDEIRSSLGSPLGLIVWFLLAIVIVIISFSVFNKIKARNAYVEAQYNSVHVSDPWADYRKSMNQPKAYATVNKTFKSISDIRDVGQIAINNFSYSGKTITIKAANFGRSIFNFYPWAKKHNYRIEKYSPNSFDMVKNISLKNAVYDDKIMIANQVKMKIIDQINQLRNALKGGVSISFNQNGYDGTTDENYEDIAFTMSVSNMPILQIIKLFKGFEIYPIFATKFSGSITLGNFTGAINLNIIGGKNDVD